MLAAFFTQAWATPDEEELAPPPPADAEEELAPPPSPPDEELAPLPKSPAAQPKDYTAWLGVREFRGYYDCTRVFTKNKQSWPSLDLAQHTMATVVRFVLQQDPNAPGLWQVKEATAAGSDQTDSHYQTGTAEGGNEKRGDYKQPVTDLTLNLDPRTGKWDFQAAGSLPQPFSIRNHVRDRRQTGTGEAVTDETVEEPCKSYAHGSIRGDLPAEKPEMLSGVWDKRASREQGVLEDTYLAHAYLFPVAEEADLVIEVTGLGEEGGEVPYAEWRPLGSLDRKPGNRLKVTARLRTPDGKPARQAVKEFVFRLKETSREPGVCLNYPLHAASGKRATADLRFEETGGAHDAERQEKRMPPRKDPAGCPFAETKVESLDWGGWADLVVQAELADGRIITGHLGGDPGALVIPLPKREPGSHIADCWKRQHQVTAADLDDSEKNPLNQRGNGDGFTLYEEYRGFVENGRHLEGDTGRIDFFIRNEIGSDARPGIGLFADLTQAVVHDRLAATEFDRKKRVMNANHAQGAHRVDQHGVVMQTNAGTKGAAAVFSQAGVRGRPGLCIGIDVQPRNAETEVTTSANVKLADLVFAYDRAIFHELLHTVGVEHHGDGDGTMLVAFVPFDDRRNPTGKSHFQRIELGRRTDIAIAKESNGRDLAQEMEGELLLYREQVLRPVMYEGELARGRQVVAERQGMPDFKLKPEDLANDALNDMFSAYGYFVGAEQGQSSGDERCAMRYYFANVYERKGKADSYWFIDRDRTERAGLELCRSEKGTGINDAGRKPQPRYGSARYGYGNCTDWVVFNDAITPAPTKLR